MTGVVPPNGATPDANDVSTVLAGLSALDVLSQDSSAVTPADYAVVLTSGGFQGGDDVTDGDHWARVSSASADSRVAQADGGRTATRRWSEVRPGKVFPRRTAIPRPRSPARTRSPSRTRSSR